MSKVKITQEQADAIEEINKLSFRTALTNRELFDAIKFGYEVEPEFKAGQWIYDITDKNKTVIEVAYVKDRRVHGFWKTQHSDIDTNVAIENARHFTKAEIAKARERSWWDKHDRGVWELNLYDCVIDEKGKPLVVVCVNHDYTKNSTRYELSNGADYPKGAMKHYFKVLYFIKDRKDV